MSGCCYRLSFLQATAEPLSLCLCGAAILNPEATLMLQFRASYDLFLMPPPPPLLVHLLSTSSLSLSPFSLPRAHCLYLSATLTVTLSAASGMQSGSEEQREGGREGGRDQNGINVSIWFMDLE